jgi:hypothetical protein
MHDELPVRVGDCRLAVAGQPEMNFLGPASMLAGPRAVSFDYRRLDGDEAELVLVPVGGRLTHESDACTARHRLRRAGAAVADEQSGSVSWPVVTDVSFEPCTTFQTPRTSFKTPAVEAGSRPAALTCPLWPGLPPPTRR